MDAPNLDAVDGESISQAFESKLSQTIDTKLILVTT